MTFLRRKYHEFRDSLKSKFPKYREDPASVLKVAERWSGGEFRLSLQGPLETRPGVGVKVIYALVLFLGWWLRVFKRPKRLLGYLILATDADVRAALGDTEGRFPVPAGPDQEALFGPPANTLGVEGKEHSLQRHVYSLVLFGDGRDLDGELDAVARDTANALLDDARGHIDAIDDLLVPVLVETARVVHGLPDEDPHALLLWSTRAAQQFVLPTRRGELSQRQSFEAARRIRGGLERTLRSKNVDPNSTLGRILDLRNRNVRLERDGFSEPAADFLTDDRIITLMTGLVFTLVTQCLPASHALHRILRRQSRVNLAQGFARHEDTAGLRAMLRECYRLHPATWPFVLREVTLADGQSAAFAGGTTLKDKETVLILIPSALRDRTVFKRPWAFDPHRFALGNGQALPTPDMDIAFGAGAHACMGRWAAETVATRLMLELFKRPGVRTSGPMLRHKGDLMPARLPVRFHAVPSRDEPIIATAAIPMRGPEGDVEAQRAHVADALARIDHAQGDPLQRAITHWEGIHGFGVTLVDITIDQRTVPHMMIELNADGPLGVAVKRLQRVAGQVMEPALAEFGWAGCTLETLFNDHALRKKARLWGNAGVTFNGIPEWSTQQIAAEKNLAEFVENHVDRLVKKAPDDPNMPLKALESARRAVCADLDLGAMLMRPRSCTPAFAAHAPIAFGDAVKNWLATSWTVRVIVAGYLLICAVIASYGLAWVWALPAFTKTLLWLGFFVLSILLLGIVLWLFGYLVWKRLRYLEKTDPVDENQPFLDTYAEVSAREDSTYSRMNHLALVVELKPGVIRRAAFTFGMWSIGWMDRNWFRPGWSANIGSIRHARLVRLKGTRQAVFLSSFDGSWSSYVGDFSDLATRGMSLVWSNCTGFLPTRNLLREGAVDDDRFKRWVRTRQVPAAIWRQRFPEMNNTRIRRNALIREGLSRRLTKSEAERWLRLFGSTPLAAPDTLRPENIQTLLFSGSGRMKASACVAVQIAPDRVEEFRKKLSALVHQTAAPKEGDDLPRISFGARVRDIEKPAAAFGLSARGLERLGVPTAERPPAGSQLHHFPISFVDGMGRRTHTLGDPDPASDDQVGWIDRADGHVGNPTEVDAVFLITGATSSDRDSGVDAKRNRMVEALIDHLGDTIEASPVTIHTEPPESGPDRPFDQRQKSAVKSIAQTVSDLARTGGTDGLSNAFLSSFESDMSRIVNPYADERRPGRRRRGIGFADGLSQPFIKGAPGVPRKGPNVVAAGEFIFGLPNEKGLYTPSPEVPAGWDFARALPDAGPLPDTFWPDFSALKAAGRDLGRDGSFMVIRQLEVDDRQFGRDMDAHRRPGTDATDDVATKIVGRRRDGSPIGSGSFDALERRQAPVHGDPVVRDDRDDMRFGDADPWGYKVPLGAHVRRANPRDSLSPDTGSELSRNRHRILRRGRRYIAEPGEEKAGLLFVCLNTSLERQFEFVQQTWINAPTFHGLQDEADPLIGNGPRHFSIPAPGGRQTVELKNDFVTFRGGGYFFVPGLAALRALTAQRGLSAAQRARNTAAPEN